jgi:alkylhydroperoxidase family enzyme
MEDLMLRSVTLVVGGALAGALLVGAMELEGRAQQAVDSAKVPKAYVRLTTPRIGPIDPKDFTDEQRAAATVNPNPDINMRTALYEPALGAAWYKWRSFLYNSPRRGDSALSLHDKELVILRVNWLCHDDWVWGQHVPIFLREGHSKEDVARIPRGPDAQGWNDNDRALLMAVEELHTTYFITDQTWSKLAVHYNTRQLLDLIFTVGNYHLNAMYTNSVGMPFVPGFGGMPPRD